MYVIGMRPLNVGGKIRQCGEPIPEAAKWKEHILRSHINLKYIMTEADYKLIKHREELRKRAAGETEADFKKQLEKDDKSDPKKNVHLLSGPEGSKVSNDANDGNTANLDDTANSQGNTSTELSTESGQAGSQAAQKPLRYTKEALEAITEHVKLKLIAEEMEVSKKGSKVELRERILAKQLSSQQ